MNKFKIIFIFIILLIHENSFSKDISLNSETDHWINLGIFGSSPEPLWKKILNTSKGDKITIKDYYIWSYDDTDWQKGGKLHLINDDSMGIPTRITCSINPDQGDKFMKNRKRISVKITGKIKGYSDFEGLLINPCTIN